MPGAPRQQGSIEVSLVIGLFEHQQLNYSNYQGLGLDPRTHVYLGS